MRKINDGINFKKGSGIGEVLKALAQLEPGNEDSFLTAEIGGKVYDFIQAKRLEDGLFHVEFARKGGDPAVFNGNELFAITVPHNSAVMLFKAFLEFGDSTPMPEAARNVTAAAAANRYE